MVKSQLKNTSNGFISTSLKFYNNYKYFIWLLIGSILITSVIFIVLSILKQGPFNSRKSSRKPPHPSPSPSPSQSNKIIGSWINAIDPNSYKLVTSGNQNLIMLASYCPDPWSVNYSCSKNTVFSLFRFTEQPTPVPEPEPSLPLMSDLTTLVSNARSVLQPGGKVLVSIGGSSFGLPDWKNLLYKYLGPTPEQPCQCPSGSYWFACDGDEGLCCNGCGTSGCGGVIDMTGCCSSGNNPHKCCCGCGNKIVKDATGKQLCVPLNPMSPCNYYGVTNADAIKKCMDDPNMKDYQKMQCVRDNTDPVRAYAEMLNIIGADGVDFDYENPDTDVSNALIKFTQDLTSYMKKTYNKDLYFSMTVLSGNSYLTYQPIYDSFGRDDCPFDYAIPMLYNGGQFLYNQNAPVDSQCNWNSLLDVWMSKKFGKNTILVPAFICYTSPGKCTFNCDQLKLFMENYINKPTPSGKTPVNGVVYFYYVDDPSSYDVKLLNNVIGATYSCFTNPKGCDTNNFGSICSNTTGQCGKDVCSAVSESLSTTKQYSAQKPPLTSFMSYDQKYSNHKLIPVPPIKYF
jgi:hypothetical protein